MSFYVDKRRKLHRSILRASWRRNSVHSQDYGQVVPVSSHWCVSFTKAQFSTGEVKRLKKYMGTSSAMLRMLPSLVAGQKPSKSKLSRADDVPTIIVH